MSFKFNWLKTIRDTVLCYSRALEEKQRGSISFSWEISNSDITSFNVLFPFDKFNFEHNIIWVELTITAPPELRISSGDSG